ncbi:MAG: hypothetical protein JHC31_06090 [Sulfurihydrogenibium sp.]|jgi:hypothetical protein|nr:hypothetical protein [Sulfurihydrogenibium sp.]
MNILKGLIRYYGFELIFLLLTLPIAIVFSYDGDALISAIARKYSIWASGLIAVFIARRMKVGEIEWRDPYDKIYAISLLGYTAIIFGNG